MSDITKEEQELMRNKVVYLAIDHLDYLRDLYKADGVKVYLQDTEHYAIKMIKDNKVKAIIRHKRNSFDNK